MRRFLSVSGTVLKIAWAITWRILYVLGWLLFFFAGLVFRFLEGIFAPFYLW